MPEKLKKKVLLVITKSNWGGAQKYVYDLATSMPHDEFDVTVVFGQGGALEDKLTVAGVRTIKIAALQRDVNIWKDFAVFFELLRIFKKEKPDVVHLNSTKIGGVGAVTGRLCGIFGKMPKIIFTAHAWAFNEKKRNILSRIAIAFLQWVMVMLSHTTIAVSQKTADQMRAFPFINKNKIKVIYNGVSEIDFINPEQARDTLINVPEIKYKKWIGTISELHTNKGIDVALTAFAEVIKKNTNAIFVVIGGGEEKSNLEKQISDLGLSNNVYLLGFIDEAKKYLKAFDIFTLTSRTEALPYAIIEAGLAELPIVASSVGGIPEIVNIPDVGLLVPTGEKAPRAIAEAINQLLVNPEHAKTLGRNLKHRIISEFSVEKMHTETFALYE